MNDEEPFDLVRALEETERNLHKEWVEEQRAKGLLPARFDELTARGRETWTPADFRDLGWEPPRLLAEGETVAELTARRNAEREREIALGISMPVVRESPADGRFYAWDRLKLATPVFRLADGRWEFAFAAQLRKDDSGLQEVTDPVRIEELLALGRDALAQQGGEDFPELVESSDRYERTNRGIEPQ